MASTAFIHFENSRWEQVFLSYIPPHTQNPCYTASKTAQDLGKQTELWSIQLIKISAPPVLCGIDVPIRVSDRHIRSGMRKVSSLHLVHLIHSPPRRESPSKVKTILPLVVPNYPAAERHVMEALAQCPKAEQMFSIAPSFVILPWK